MTEFLLNGWPDFTAERSHIRAVVSSEQDAKNVRLGLHLIWLTSSVCALIILSNVGSISRITLTVLFQ